MKPHTHAGLVLAAGASSRMGRPKALLPTGAGIPLAEYQYGLLKKSGCSPVYVVTGSSAEQVANGLGCPCIRNEAWASGRMSSIKEGLRAVPPGSGCLILPVDTVGVRITTLQTVLATADREEPDAVRPVFDDRNGKVLWLAPGLVAEIRTAAYDEDARLDEIIRDRALRVNVDDPAILNNVNTPEEWERTKDRLGD